MRKRNLGGLLLAGALFFVWCFRKIIGDQFLIIIGERTTVSGPIKDIMAIPDRINNQENYFINVLDDYEEENRSVKISKEDFEKISLMSKKEKLYTSVFCKREENKLIALEFKVIEKYEEI